MTFVEIPDFALVAIHTSPNDVVDELNHMVTVHAAITNNWYVQRVFLNSPRLPVWLAQN